MEDRVARARRHAFLKHLEARVGMARATITNNPKEEKDATITNNPKEEKDGSGKFDN